MSVTSSDHFLDKLTWQQVSLVLGLFDLLHFMLENLSRPIVQEWLTKIGVIYRGLLRKLEKLHLVVDVPKITNEMMGDQAVQLRKMALKAISDFGAATPFRERDDLIEALDFHHLLSEYGSFMTSDKEMKMKILACCDNSNEMKLLLESTKNKNNGENLTLLPLVGVINRKEELEIANLIFSESEKAKLLEKSQNWHWLDLESNISLYKMATQPKSVLAVETLSKLFSRWSRSQLNFEMIPWMRNLKSLDLTCDIPLLTFNVALLSPSSQVSLRHVACWKRIVDQFKNMSWQNLQSVEHNSDVGSQMEHQLLNVIMARFFTSLGVSSGNSWQNSIILSKLMEKCNNVQEIFNMFQEKMQSDDSGWKYLISGALMLVIFGSYLDSDPADVAATRLAAVEIEISNMKSEMKAFNSMYLNATGNECSGISNIHRRVDILDDKIEKCESKVEKLQKNLACRPKDLNFDEIKHFLKQVTSDLLSHEKLVRLSDQESSEQISETMKKSLEIACDKMKKFTTCFPDLLVPLNLALEMVNFGFVKLEKMNRNLKLTKSEDVLEKTCRIMMETPRRFDSVKMIRLIEQIGNSFRKSDRQFGVSLLTCFLHYLSEIPNGCQFKQVEETFACCFMKLLQIWQIVAAERRQRDIEREATYKYKIKTHCDDPVTDEEKDEADVRKLFPDYDKEFNDDENDDDDQDDDEKMEGAEGEHGSKQKNENENDLIDCSMVFQMFNTFLNFDTLATSSSDRLFESLFSLFFNREISLNKLNLEESSVLIRSTLYAHRKSLQSLGQQQMKDNLSDFYFGQSDNFLAPVADQLNTLLAKIDRFLAEWPEHPQLVSLRKIVDQVLDLPAGSTPPAKILAGLERVYEESQVWEQSAGKMNTLHPELGYIITIILDGRKRQLDSWQGLLDGVLDDSNQQACSNFMKFSEVVLEQVFNEFEVDEQFRQFCVAFLETSRIGEFKNRLQICRILSKVPTMFKKTEKSLQIQTILSNLACFYEQFEPVVTSYIAEQRKPIEKELKEFVKISRWNDANFWRVKTSVHNAHKKLARARRLFAEILVTPISTILTADRLLPKFDAKKKSTSNFELSCLEIPPIESVKKLVFF